MVNIVIPMAGNGLRFQEAGYKLPKPFIDLNGVPMIEAVIKNIYLKNAKYFLIAKQEHLENNQQIAQHLIKNYNITFITLENNKTTEGAACTVLHARKHINNNEPLIFANSDQIIDIDLADFVKDAEQRNLDGSILTFEDKELNPKWSFAKIDKDGYVERVAEKIVISNQATVGIYYFKQGKIFVDAAIDMIARNDRFNNEFYVCPTYNYAIKEGHKIGIYEISSEKMHGIGTPQDLDKYLHYCKK